MTVLVAYASRHGATRGVAERIGARLVSRGLTIHLDPLLGQEEVTRFEAVVIGSPVYSGHWEDEAVAFIRRNAGPLTGHPVWTFSVGWLAHHRGVLHRESWSDAKGLAQLDQLLPAREHRFFAGAMAPAETQILRRLAFRLAGGRYGDFRDWDAIDAWADEIAHQLTAPDQTPAMHARPEVDHPADG